jgi:hypothetical protein
MNRLAPLLLGWTLLATPAAAQVAGKFPPDSLVNVRVIPRNTPVIQVVGQMRNITGALGVRCPYCHVGQEGQDLSTFDFPADDKRTKLVARQMLSMVQEINRRLDTIPTRPVPPVEVTCQTCHRGVARPVPLSALLQDVATSAGADSAVRAYRALRERYYGRAAYDFGPGSLNTAAFQLGRAGKFGEASALFALNDEQFPTEPQTAILRGNVLLMRQDTTGAADAYREALRRNPGNGEALGRLRTIGRQP